jgi:hypothetical protein
MLHRRKPVFSAVSEFSAVHLGDARRDARVLRVVRALEDDPSRGFPTAVGTIAEREALYRLLNNAAVTLDSLMRPHVLETAQRARQTQGSVLVAIDKTDFVFTGEADRDGLDRLGKDRHGFSAFVGLAVNLDRRPLGVLDIRSVEGEGRSRAEAWSEVVEASAKHLHELDPIFIMDREADAFALFAKLLDAGRSFVVRAKYDRLIGADGATAQVCLREVTARQPVLLTRTVKLSRRTAKGRPPTARKKHPPRDERLATLEIRACRIALPRPPKLRDPVLPDGAFVNVVHVTEADAPPGHDPVDWLLFTNQPIDDEASVASVVDAYRCRWVIEEYFKALKTGCSYEKRQLESKHALLNALGLLAPLAWRLLALRAVAHSDANALASTVLSDDEITVLRKISLDIKLGPRPAATTALLALARLGGHFPQNGRPGWMVIWRGFQKLIDRVEGYLLAKAEM